jgi:hypothetical protein
MLQPIILKLVFCVQPAVDEACGEELTAPSQRKSPSGRCYQQISELAPKGTPAQKIPAPLVRTWKENQENSEW